MKRLWNGILTVVGWIVGGVIGFVILVLNVALLLFVLWMVFGGGCEAVGGGGR